MNIKSLGGAIKDNEEVAGIYHRFMLADFWHWLTGAALFLGPFFFMYLFLRAGAIGLLLLLAPFVAGIFYLLRTYRIWRNSALLVTNEKIVVLTQTGYFDRTVAQVLLDKINDVSYRKRTLWQSLFDFGTVSIQVTASGEKLNILNLRRPAQIQQTIFNAQAAYLSHDKTEFTEAELLGVIREIRSRIGENRWQDIIAGNWEIKQNLIDEVRKKDDSRARAIEQFFRKDI